MYLENNCKKIGVCICKRDKGVYICTPKTNKGAEDGRSEAKDLRGLKLERLQIEKESRRESVRRIDKAGVTQNVL